MLLVRIDNWDHAEFGPLQALEDSKEENDRHYMVCALRNRVVDELSAAVEKVKIPGLSDRRPMVAVGSTGLTHGPIIFVAEWLGGASDLSEVDRKKLAEAITCAMRAMTRREHGNGSASKVFDNHDLLAVVRPSAQGGSNVTHFLPRPHLKPLEQRA